MRVSDLVRPHLDGVRLVVDATPPSFDLRTGLRLPTGVRYRRCDADELDRAALGPGTLLLAAVPPAREADGEAGGQPDSPLGSQPDSPLGSQPEEQTLARVLDGLAPGTRGAVLFDRSALDLPYHRLLGPFVRYRCQVMQLASLERAGRGIGRGAGRGVGAVFYVVDRPAAIRGYLGWPITDAPGSGAKALAIWLRLAGEFVVADFVGRAMRARLRDLESDGERASSLAVRVAELESELASERERAHAAENAARAVTTAMADLLAALGGPATPGRR